MEILTYIKKETISFTAVKIYIFKKSSMSITHKYYMTTIDI